mgnify:CR=1 FL=1
MIRIIKVTEAKSVHIEYANRTYWIRQTHLEEDLIALVRDAEYAGRCKLQKDLKSLLAVPV